MRYIKYEFADKATFENLKANHLTQTVGEETALIKGIDVVEIGDIVKTAGTYDEDGNELTAPVMRGNHAVDILWRVEPIAEFEVHETYPDPCGVHTFAGLEYLYELEYYNKFPELKPKEDEIREG